MKREPQAASQKEKRKRASAAAAADSTVVADSATATAAATAPNKRVRKESKKKKDAAASASAAGDMEDDDVKIIGEKSSPMKPPRPPVPSTPPLHPTNSSRKLKLESPTKPKQPQKVTPVVSTAADRMKLPPLPVKMETSMLQCGLCCVRYVLMACFVVVSCEDLSMIEVHLNSFASYLEQFTVQYKTAAVQDIPLAGKAPRPIVMEVLICCLIDSFAPHTPTGSAGGKKGKRKSDAGAVASGAHAISTTESGVPLTWEELSRQVETLRASGAKCTDGAGLSFRILTFT